MQVLLIQQSHYYYFVITPDADRRDSQYQQMNRNDNLASARVAMKKLSKIYISQLDKRSLQNAIHHNNLNYQFYGLLPLHHIMAALAHHTHLQSMDLKSRQQLTNLLDQQLDRNQILENENSRLEKQQTKLVHLLQMRTEQLKKLRANRTMNQQINCKYVAQDVQGVQGVEKNGGNQSTALYAGGNNTTVGHEGDSELVESLKDNLREKDQEMGKMREYYTRFLQKMEKEQQRLREAGQQQLQVQIDQYRQIVSKQKQRITQLLSALQWSQQQKTSLQSQVQSLSSTTCPEQLQMLQQQLQRCKKQLQHQGDEHSIQKQQILETHCEELQTMQANTIYKIQQIQDKCRREVEQYRGVVDQKCKYAQKLEEDLYAVQKKFKQQLIRYEQQCQIVMSMQQSKTQLEQTLQKTINQLHSLQEEVQTKTQTHINLDNIHKQYSIQLSQKQSEINTQVLHCKELEEQLERALEQNLKNQSKIQEIIRKNGVKVGAMEGDLIRLRDRVGGLEEELVGVNSQVAILEQDNKRLMAKMAKDAQKKDNYTKKLQQKIQKLQTQIQESQDSLHQKQSDILAYKDQMRNLIQILKDEIQKKDKEITSLHRQTQKKEKQWEHNEQQNKQTILNIQNQMQDCLRKYGQVCQKNKFVEEERNNFKHLYEDSLKEVKNLDANRKKIQMQFRGLQQQRDKLQKEVEYLKEEILANNLAETQKEQLHGLRNQVLQHRARANKLNDTIAKIKDEHARATRENLGLEDRARTLEGQVTKLTNQLNLKKERIEELEEELSEVQSDLKERCKELETSMPYLNKVLEEKKQSQLQLEKKTNEIKKLINLVELAKKSKAEEIISLTKECQSMSHKASQLELEIRENREVIERFNREKVNMLRENTVREDMLKKVQLENNTLKLQLKESHANIEEMMKLLDVASVANRSSELEQEHAWQRRGSRR